MDLPPSDVSKATTFSKRNASGWISERSLTNCPTVGAQGWSLPRLSCLFAEENGWHGGPPNTIVPLRFGQTLSRASMISDPRVFLAFFWTTIELGKFQP